MTIWPPKRDDLKRPAYRSLAERLEEAIEAGELRSGDRLPTHRQLAYDLGLSVQTVSRAYEELIRRGVIGGEVGRGTFVRAAIDETRIPYRAESHYGSIIELSILKPVCEDLHIDLMRQALGRLATDLPPTAVTSFRPSGALRRYQSASLRWLRHCGLDPRPQSLLLTNGATPAMTIALMSAAAPGDLVVTEELGHHTLKPLAGYLGLRLKGLPIDADGIVPDAFEATCRNTAVKALYLMPSGLSPSAVTMPIERREALVALARRHDVLIIENDAWGPLDPDRPPPIAHLAPERTAYFTSMTKCIMPGLRLGFLIIPETLESAAANRHLVTNWMATALVAEIATGWIDDGTADRLVAWQRRALGERNRMAANVLHGLSFAASPNGMHVWLPLPAPWTESTFVAHARLHGVAVAPGSSFEISNPQAHPGVRICLGAEGRQAFLSGLEILARLARSRPEPALLGL